MSPFIYFLEPFYLPHILTQRLSKKKMLKFLPTFFSLLTVDIKHKQTCTQQKFDFWIIFLWLYSIEYILCTFEFISFHKKHNKVLKLTLLYKQLKIIKLFIWNLFKSKILTKNGMAIFNKRTAIFILNNLP